MVKISVVTKMVVGLPKGVSVINLWTFIGLHNQCLHFTIFLMTDRNTGLYVLFLHYPNYLKQQSSKRVSLIREAVKN
jgi:hypothetical protein